MTSRLLLLAVAAWGCSPDTPAHTFTVADSAGVEVVTSRAPAWGEGEGWRLGPEPILRIGAASGDPRYELYDIEGAHRLADGRIVVAEGGSRQLRFYGPDGAWIRDVAGEGEGPGEFRWITSMTVAGDSIWVADPGLARLSVFDARGEYVRSVSFAQTEEGWMPGFAGRLADGRLILVRIVSPWSTDPEPGVQSLRGRYLLTDPHGNVRKDLGEFEQGQHLVRVHEDRVSSMAVLWGRRAYFAATADGFLYGSGERYRVLEYDPTGALRRIVRLDEEPEPVDAGAFGDWADSVAARSDDPSAVRQRLRERYDGVRFPETKPTWTDLRVGAEGDLWLKRFSSSADGPERWTVFDSTGVHLGTMTMPEGFALIQVGMDFVLGVTTNELDVEAVEMYPLARGGVGDGAG